MKSLSRNLLMGAILAALPMSGALACTVSQWNGAKTAVDGDTKGPGDGVSRYSGLCALNSTAAGNYVGDNHPVNDPQYNGRFYVFTGISGTAEVFGAYGADDGGGGQLIGITYDSGAGQFQFSANGATGNLGGIQANKWYSIEFAYDAGSSFSAQVAGASGFSGSPTISGTPGASNIESARLGWISGSGSGNQNTDEFESTRGVAIGRLLVGDANADLSCNANDLSMTANEILSILLAGSSFANGQPDCTEDGSTDANDLSCISTIVLDDLLNGTTCGI